MNPLGPLEPAHPGVVTRDLFCVAAHPPPVELCPAGGSSALSLSQLTIELFHFTFLNYVSFKINEIYFILSKKMLSVSC